MSFNLDSNNQAQELNFSKRQRNKQSPSNFSKITLSQTTSQKHFGVIVESRLSSDKHLISV